MNGESEPKGKCWHWTGWVEGLLHPWLRKREAEIEIDGLFESKLQLVLQPSLIANSNFSHWLFSVILKLYLLRIPCDFPSLCQLCLKNSCQVWEVPRRTSSRQFPRGRTFICTRKFWGWWGRWQVSVPSSQACCFVNAFLLLCFLGHLT